MNSTRRTATVAGVFFLVTEVAAMAGLTLYGPALHDAGYVAGPGTDGRVLLGGFCELILVVAVVGTAVTLYPVVRRQNHAVALGYVCGRLPEAAVIVVGIVSVLSVVTLRQDLGSVTGADRSALIVVGRSLVAVHDWTFLLGPNLVLGVNSLLLAYLMCRSGLAPRIIATLGFVGGTLILISATAVMFGLYGLLSAWGSIAAIPVFAWEVSLAATLILKGFTSSGPNGQDPSRSALQPHLADA